jgi:hypothetical protein
MAPAGPPLAPPLQLLGFKSGKVSSEKLTAKC